MILPILEKINGIHQTIFTPIDKAIGSLSFDGWVNDAIIDSVHLLPFLFFIFVVIEVIEFYFSNKINNSFKKTRKRSVLIGSLASIFPQCGFSVMASSLYSRKIISIGCLVAVYIGTSDECLPILLANPQKAHLVIPIVCAKFLIAVITGYFLDFIFKEIKSKNENSADDEHLSEMGCCQHDIESKNKKELILHPILHTLNIFIFILIITLILNYLFEHLSLADVLTKNTNSYIVCTLSALIGLIPNCAVSVAITMLLIKGQIAFGAAMSGLISNCGLGLLVLLKNNDFKDTIKIISILLFISIVSGIAINLLNISI